MKSLKLAYASLSISGDRLVPADWTTYFGLTPDRAITKGDPIRDPTGQNRKLTRRTGVWGVSSKAAIDSDDLAPHLRYLIRVAGLPRADLRARMEQADARVRFFCFWRSQVDGQAGTRIPDVPQDVRQLCDAQGIEIDIDEYR